MNDELIKVKWLRKMGIIIFGGGVVKYYICNSNLM